MTPPFLRQIVEKSYFIDLPGMLPGMLLHIQIEDIGSSQSRLIGMDYGNFIVIKAPLLAGIESQLFEKNRCMIRYSFSGNVYAFQCTLLDPGKAPYRISILSYPEAVENMNLRAHERKPCVIAAEVNLKGGVNQGIVSNISMGGCLFEFNRISGQAFPQLDIYGETVIALYLNGQGTATVFKATIRKVHMDKESVTTGLQFTASVSTEPGSNPEWELKEYLLTLRD